ncbi:LysM peptidoglycan-binding domain-containing protein [Pseudarthrobacter sp. J64]|uniref:lytic transglycosylase n=1 Tax=Pseudarthrobacter sp. J64 TaxID=3116485 RepID=UPI002E817F23|nr:LysM peptidoglycan-binding domain-containing protein [Pseudarthrobacter sp. J64]MEE2569593.1 LysM peptidoglycan-binding domain-containing protein [Pseudarthrobacter sp. J64]
MTPTRLPQQPIRSRLPRMAAATAAMPAVILTSLAVAQPAQAQKPARPVPASLAAAIQAQAAAVTPAVIPAAAVPATLPTAFRPASPSTPLDYTVVQGDTVTAIAAKFGLKTSEVLAANNLSASSVIYPGQKIKLTGQPAAAAPTASPAPAPAPAEAASYAVKAGDTLTGIAASHGVSLSELLEWNQLSPTKFIQPGQQIKVSAPGGTPTVAPLQAASSVTPLVPSTFLGFEYPAAVVSSANENKAILNNSPVPSRDEMRAIVVDTARSMGVDPTLAMAFAYQESGFNQRAVSPANAIGTMQVIPSSGEWASDMVGRRLNLLDPHDNATAGVAIISRLLATSDGLENAIAGYYQGQYSVSKNGMYDDTKDYVAAILAHQKNFQ